MTPEIRCHGEPRAVLGEGPVWDPAARRLLWVDCDRRTLHAFDPSSGATASTPMPGNPGSHALRERGGRILAYRNRLVLADGEDVDGPVLDVPGVDFSVERFNDGACDRQGRFWVGTMHKGMQEPVGHLYRIDPDRSVHCMASGLTVSNGIGFSPDGATMYHTDSPTLRIFAYDLDTASGTLARRRVFADFSADGGRPDGCTVDAEGCVWVAIARAGKVCRHDPAGRRVATVALPVSRPTSVMFGDDDLRTLYVTSMQHGLTPEQLEREPLSGCLFSIRTEVPGLPEPRFAG